jgi:lipopolysaccharide export system protein LptA
MSQRHLALAFAACLIALPAALSAQGMRVPFGGLSHDANAQVEVSADQLSVSQADGTATFSGNVVVGQGEMRLSAALVRVEYHTDGGGIARLHAEGGVTLVSGNEAAEAREAVYDIDAGRVVMTGEVLLTEDGNALSGDRLVIDLNAGTAQMEGRVRTILQGGSRP